MASRWVSAVCLAASIAMLIAPWLAPSFVRSKPVVVIDDSRSVDQDALHRLTSELSPTGRYDIRLASEPGVTQQRPFERNREPFGRSDIASAVSTALADSDEVIIVSDGRFTDAGADLPSPPNRLTMVLVDSRVSPRIGGVSTPLRVPSGRAFDARVTILGTTSTSSMRVSWSLGDASGATLVAPQTEGATVVPVTVPDHASGNVPLVFRLEAVQSGDVVDVWNGDIQVSQPPLVGLVGASSLAQALTSAGFAVVQDSPGVGFPAQPDVVVTDRSLAATEAAVGEVVPYVERGGGLVLLGGSKSFRAGGWQDERVEAVLPVRLLPEPGSGEAIAVVLDRSTSMAQGDRLGRSVTGIIQLLSRLEGNDRFGVVSFASDVQIDVPFGLVTSSARLQAEDALRAVDANGGTYIDPALDRALAWLEAVDAVRREIVIVTDGELSEGRPQLAGVFDTESFVMRAEAAGITVQAVAIGDRADVEDLESMVVPTGGSVAVAADGKAIAERISEASDRTPDAWFIDPTRPVSRLSHPINPTVEPLTSQRWHQATEKPDASPVVHDADERLGVAAANVASGRTVAFMASDWSGIQADVIRAAWWAQNARQDVQVSVATVDSDNVRVIVTASDNVGFRRWVVRAGGVQVPLVETSPGRFEVVLDRVDGMLPTAVISDGLRFRRSVQLPGTREMDPAVDDGVAWVTRNGGTTVTSWPESSSFMLRTQNNERPYVPFIWLSGLFFLMAVWSERRGFTRQG